MIKHQDKPEEKLEQKLSIFQKSVRIGLAGLLGLTVLGAGRFGKFMSNVQLKSTEEARKGTYIFSEPFKNATEGYFKTEKEYRLSLNPLQIAEVAAKGMYMGGITELVMIEYGIRQLKK